jgi:peptide chain release factor 2
LNRRSFAANLRIWQGGFRPWGGFFDIAAKQKRLSELEEQANASDIWKSGDSAKSILKERSTQQNIINAYNGLQTSLGDAQTAFELAQESGDTEFYQEAQHNISVLEEALSRQEFMCKMHGEYDRLNAIIEINAGSGGTEAQDWALMLLRMYVRWAERKGFKVEELDYRAGEEAGIKSATLYVEGEFAYGYLRGEQGVHRLVRISPFDSNARRHTSFASVAVTPDTEEEIAIEVDEKDLRIDTYRSSGAGGQHVNKTDSAVRLTHIPTGIVVCCQNERSQHKNKAMAMKVLKAKLFELQQQEQEAKLAEIKGTRKKIDFGSQIRSYVLHPYKMIKDLRTDFETSSVDQVLDGDLGAFIETYLLSDENKNT